MDERRMHDPSPAPFWRSRFGIGWLALAAVAGWFLWAEHRAHVLGVLPWLLLAACPLMHVFMHRGHHGHHEHMDRDRDPAEARPPAGTPAPPGHPGHPS